MSPAELMFARKIKFVFNKLLPERKTRTSKSNYINTYFKLEEKVFFRIYQRGKEFWQDGVVKKHIGRMAYIIQGQRREHKRHVNQLKRRFTELKCPQMEVPMEILYDTFNVPTPAEIVQPRV